MKENLPYEKLIAEKMKGLPVPDKEESWQQMKTILDNELPVSMKGKRGPGGKWWWMSSFAVIMMMGTGLFFYLTTKQVIPKQLTQINKADKANPHSTSDHSNSSIGNTSTLQDKKETTPKLPEPEMSGAVSSDKQNGDDSKPHLNVKPDNTDKNIADSKNTLVVNATESEHKNETAKLENKGITSNNSLSDVREKGFVKGKNNAGLKRSKPEKFNAFQDGQQNNISSLDVNYSIQNARSSNVSQKAKDIRIKPYKNNIAANEDELLASFAIEHADDDNPFKDISFQKVKTFNERSLIVYADENNPGIDVPTSVSALPDVKAQQKKILKEMKRRERREERDLAKSYRSNQSFWGVKTDRWFAAGIAPFQSFAIASQQSYNYNSAGSKGTASDYIPSPYLQLHVTNRIYLMSEFQFNAPQATPNLLLSQKNINTPMNVAGCTEHIYLRKLYYFNLPLSFYYSPVKNFYVGSGIQFSSLNSGLAYVEQRSANNTLVHSETVKIKDDQFSSKIKGSEWRYLFDANYYVDRFMFGFRYNQALNNYINLSAAANHPLTQARNQAFQFYLRYNIIVSNKKR